MILWSHELSSMPIATPTAARETDSGLWLEAEFHTTRAAQDARKIIRERADRGKGVWMSIGYVPEDFDFRDDGVRVLKSVSLVEVSVTCMPANRQALITSAKAGRPRLATHRDRRRVWIDWHIMEAKFTAMGLPPPKSQAEHRLNQADRDDAIRQAENALEAYRA